MIHAKAPQPAKAMSKPYAIDYYRYIMDLCTNAGIVSDAMKFVTQKKEQIDTLQKTDGWKKKDYMTRYILVIITSSKSMTVV